MTVSELSSAEMNYGFLCFYNVIRPCSCCCRRRRRRCCSVLDPPTYRFRSPEATATSQRT